MEKTNKVAATYTPKPDSDELMVLARVVRSLEGARRYKQPLGSPITKKIKELAKIEAPTKIDPVTGKVKNKGPSGAENHKIFAQKVAELKKSLEKLDKAAIENLLKQLEDSKNLPKSANYEKIRKMLRSYLKDKKDDPDTKVK